MRIPEALRLLLLGLLLAAVGCPTSSVLDDDDSTAGDADADDSKDDDASPDHHASVPEWQDCAPPLVDDPPPDPLDCNADGVSDAAQLSSGEAFDCNLNGVLDECEIIDDACVLYGAREFVEYDAGSLPIIISAPHGGLVAPADIPDRAAATGSRDVNTIQLARALDAALFAATGRHAHLVICQLHRDKIDCNRSLEAAQDGHPETEAAWFEYHSFLDAAKRAVTAQHGRGLYIDLHGLASSRDKSELGYLLYPSQLFEPDERLSHPGYARRSSVRTLADENGGDLVELIRGLDSLGAHIQAGGFDAVPSPAFPDPGYDADGDANHYFNGGYNTVRHGSQGGGLIDGLQIEAMWDGVRDSSESRAAFGAALTTGLLDWLPAWQGLDVMARNLVRLGPVQGWASERGAIATVPVRRSGDLSVPLTVGLAWSGDLGDVDAVPDSVEFEEDEDQVLVEVSAIPEEANEGPGALQVEVLPGDGYNVVPDARASLHVVDASRPGLLISGDGPLLEGDTLDLTLRRDGCGIPVEARLQIGGDASADDLLVNGLPLTSDGIPFSAKDDTVTVTLSGVEDGVLESLEFLDLGLVTPDPTVSPAPNLRIRLVDADQDPDLLAFFDGRTDGPLLVEAGEQPVRAELLPSPATGPQPGSGGPAGAFLSFDEEDDVVIVDDVEIPGPFTVAFGFRAAPDLSDGFRYLYGHGNVTSTNHLNVFLTTAGTLRTSLRGSGDASEYSALDVAGDYRDAEWHHWALVVEPGEPSSATVYVDGVQAATAARGGPSFDPPHPIFLGGRWDLSPTRDFKGDLDEIRLVDRALTPTEIATLAAPFTAP